MYRVAAYALFALSAFTFTAHADNAAVIGEWKGSFFCYPQSTPFTMTVQPLESSETPLETILSFKTYRQETHRYIGVYDALSATFDLSLPRELRHRTGHRPIVALIDGQKLIGRFTSSNNGSCTYIIADRDGTLVVPDDTEPAIPSARQRELRDEAAKFLQQEDMPALCERFTRWAERLRDEFDPKTLVGMSDVYDVAQILTGDAEFASLIGKTYDQVSLSERSSLRAAFMQHCKSSFSRDDGGIRRAIENMLRETGQGSRRQMLSASHGIRQLRAWRDQALEEVDAMDVSATAIERLWGLARAGETHLEPLWPSERGEFLSRLKARTSELAPGVAIARAEAAAARSTGYADLPSLMAWTEENAELLEYLSPNERDAATDIVMRRVGELLDELAPLELASLPPAGADRVALDASTAWYEDFRDRYAPVIGSENFAGVIGEFRERRDSTLLAIGPATISKIDAATAIGEVDALLSSIIAVPGDRHSQAGSKIHAAGEARKQSIEVRQFMARFSQREQVLMERPGRLTPPSHYVEPTGQEVRLAILREIASMGGSFVDERTALLAIPPFGALGFNVEVALQDPTSLSCTQAERGYRCAYTMPMANTLPDEVRQFFAGHPLHSRLVDIIAAVLNTQQELTMTDDFVLTETGWRSPTASARRLDGILAHYKTMGEAMKNIGDAHCSSLLAYTDWGGAWCN